MILIMNLAVCIRVIQIDVFLCARPQAHSRRRVTVEGIVPALECRVL